MDQTIKNQSDQLTYKERDTRIIKHTTKWRWQMGQGITMFQENRSPVLLIIYLTQNKTKSLHQICKIKSAFYTGTPPLMRFFGPGTKENRVIGVFYIVLKPQKGEDQRSKSMFP